SGAPQRGGTDTGTGAGAGAGTSPEGGARGPGGRVAGAEGRCQAQWSQAGSVRSRRWVWPVQWQERGRPAGTGRGPRDVRAPGRAGARTRTRTRTRGGGGAAGQCGTARPRGGLPRASVADGGAGVGPGTLARPRGRTVAAPEPRAGASPRSPRSGSSPR